MQDTVKAFAWYENQRIGLGIEFLDEVELYLGRITQNPKHYPAQREIL